MFPAMKIKNLSVTGKSIVLKSKYSPQLATRKIYNSTFFRDEKYRHEIANHYRDFIQRPRISRRRRRNVFVHYRKPAVAVSFGADPFEYRDELKIKVHTFPRFAQVYTPPRGRQCECENRPPDETYNDTVRRIRAVTTFEELKALVQRHSGYIARKENSWRQHNWRRRRKLQNFNNSKFKENLTLHSDLNAECRNENLRQSKKNTQQAQQKQRRQKRRRSLGNLESVSLVQCKQTQLQFETKAAYTSTGTGTGTSTSTRDDEPEEEYIKLASDYYEHGLLANIKFLESIPERNAIVRARGEHIRTSLKLNDNEATTEHNSSVVKQSTTTISAYENNSNHSRIAYAKSNALYKLKATEEIVKNSSDEIKNKIENIFRFIGRQQRSSFNLSEKNKFKNLAIRVNIKTSAHHYSEIELRSQAQIKDLNQISASSVSMHDLNANTGFITAQIFEPTNNLNHNNNSSNNHNNSSTYVNNTFGVECWSSSSSSKHLHNLIDNLTHLDLNATSAAATAVQQQTGLVPRITLTDYCNVSDLNKCNFYTEQEPQTFFAFNSASSSSASNSAFVLKPTKFANRKTNLNIPSDNNFQNEARPP